jgi:hypothetical protein
MAGRGLKALFGAAIVMAVFAQSASAGTVTTATDSGNTTTQGELRTEVSEGGAVTIAPGIQPVLLDDPIIVTKDVTITGQGASSTTIAANLADADRIRFLVIGVGVDPAPTVGLNGVTVKNFRGGDVENGAVNGGNGQSGGAIAFLRGILEIRDSVFAANRAGIGGDGGTGFGGAGGSGGAIFAETGTTLIVRRSSFASEAGHGGSGVTGGAGGGGGAIFTRGNLGIENSTFHGSKAGNGGQAATEGALAGDGGSGGALQLAGGAIASISGSNFEGNRPGHGGGAELPGLMTGSGDDAGGGGAIHSTGASLQMVNSTIQLNGGAEGSVNDARGGGILVEDSTDTLSFVTIAGNGGILGGPVQNGSGIFTSGGGSAVLRNSILSTNYSVDITPGLNCEGSVSGEAGTANISFPPGAGCAGFATGDPKLLFDIVSPDGTLPLQAGSAAIDAAPNGSCTFGGAALGSDQLGRPRPSGAACDLGASEFQQGPAPALPVSPGAKKKKKCKKPKKKTKKALKKYKKCKKKAKKK